MTLPLGPLGTKFLGMQLPSKIPSQLYARSLLCSLLFGYCSFAQIIEMSQTFARGNPFSNAEWGSGAGNTTQI